MKKYLTVVIMFTMIFLAGAQTIANDELRIGVQSFTKSLDAQEAVSNAAIQVFHNLFDPLISRAKENGKMVFKPALAESWKQVSPMVWEFKLRKGVKFHDGSELTADDVVFSLERPIKQTDPRFRNCYGFYFHSVESVEAVDKYTVRFKTIKPDPLLLTILSDPNAGITSKAHYAKLGQDKAAVQLIATGPYKVTSFEPGETLVMERFDDYWGAKAPLRKVTYRRIPEIASRMTALVNNEVDFIVSIPPDQEAAISGNRNVKLVGTAWPMFHVYVVNMSHPVTKNQKLRQAMDLAIDRVTLTKALWQGKGIPATSHQFSDYGEPMYMPEIKNITYDPQKAARLVKESGYDGTPIVIWNTTNYYTYADLATQAVIEMWKKVGINAKLNQVDSIPADHTNVMVRTWSNPLYYPDPMGVMGTHWGKFSWPYTRNVFTPDESWFTLFEQARYSTNVEERKKAYKGMLEKAAEMAGYILLYQPYESYAMNKNVNWTISKTERPYTISLRAGDITITK